MNLICTIDYCFILGARFAGNIVLPLVLLPTFYSLLSTVCPQKTSNSYCCIGTCTYPQVLCMTPKQVLTAHSLLPTRISNTCTVHLFQPVIISAACFANIKRFANKRNACGINCTARWLMSCDHPWHDISERPNTFGMFRPLCG